MRRRKQEGMDVVGDLAKGALAGMVATWVMGRVTSYLYEHEPKEAREEEGAARGDRPAYDTAAEKGAAAIGVELTVEQRARTGSLIHWAVGAGAGAVYGLARLRVPGADAAAGLLFGTAFWMIVDEGANYAFGLTPGPRAFPWQAHARGLVGHLVFGAAAHASLNAMDAAA